jgi:hypothetical protein
VATFVDTVGTSNSGASPASITPTFPSFSAGDLMLIAVGGKYAATASAGTTPTGWTFIKRVTGGTVTTGNDAGDSFIHLYGRIMVGGDTTVAFPVTSANSLWAIAQTWTPAGGKVWTRASDLSLIPWVAADDTTGGSAVLTGSGTFSTQPVAANGAQLNSWAAFPSDAGSAITSPATTNSGLSSPTQTTRTYVESTGGADSGGASWTTTGFTGTATGTTTMTVTITGLANGYGPLLSVWLEESTATPLSLTDTARGVWSGTPTQAFSLPAPPASDLPDEPFEGGNGDALTTSNTDAATTILSSGTSAATYSTSVLKAGTASALFTSTTGLRSLEWVDSSTQTDRYYSLYIRPTASPSANTVIHYVGNTSSARTAQLVFNADRTFKIQRETGLIIGSNTTTAAPLNEWTRVDWSIVGSTVTLEVYPGTANCDNAVGTAGAGETRSGATTPPSNPMQYQSLGIVTSTTNSFYLDAFRNATTATPDPVVGSSPLDLTDTATGTRTAGPTEAMTIGVEVSGGAPASARVATTVEALTLGLTHTDTARGSLVGTPTQAATFGLELTDRASGTWGGTPGQSFSLPAALPLTLTDTAVGSRAGAPTETFDATMPRTDTASAAWVSAPTPVLTLGLTVTDTASSARSGAPTQALTLGLSVTDAATAARTGNPPQDVGTTLEVADRARAVSGGTPPQAATFGLTWTDSPTALNAALTTELAAFGLVLQDLAVGARARGTTDAFSAAGPTVPGSMTPVSVGGPTVTGALGGVPTLTPVAIGGPTMTGG